MKKKYSFISSVEKKVAKIETFILYYSIVKICGLGPRLTNHKGEIMPLALAFETHLEYKTNLWQCRLF